MCKQCAEFYEVTPEGCIVANCDVLNLNDDQLCKVCEDGYYVFQGHCVEYCPLGTYNHQGRCIDNCPQYFNTTTLEVKSTKFFDK